MSIEQFYFVVRDGLTFQGMMRRIASASVPIGEVPQEHSVMFVQQTPTRIQVNTWQNESGTKICVAIAPAGDGNYVLRAELDTDYYKYTVRNSVRTYNRWGAGAESEKNYWTIKGEPVTAELAFATMKKYLLKYLRQQMPPVKRLALWLLS